MTLNDNKVASVLVNICRRSNDLDLILYGQWLESKGAIPIDFDALATPPSGPTQNQ